MEIHKKSNADEYEYEPKNTLKMFLDFRKILASTFL